MSYDENINKVKESAEFLNLEVEKSNFVIARCGRGVYNFKKDQIKDLSHTSTVDFFINPKNSVNTFPFGVSQFYIDFDLPKIEYSIFKFILRFSLYVNAPGSNGNIIINNIG